MTPKNILVVYGTRPEAVKLAPVVHELKALGHAVTTFSTGQHSGNFADFLVDIALNSSIWKDGLAYGISVTLWEISIALPRLQPDIIIVQGDTASAYVGALAGFLAEVPVAHVEAGLRTYAETPYPEESFRRSIAAMASIHFCPDMQAATNIQREWGGLCPEGHKLYVTGNTVIDTMKPKKLRVLGTFHRRENWGAPIREVLDTLNNFANSDKVEVDVISHPNWESKALPGVNAPNTWKNILFLQAQKREKLLHYFERHYYDIVVTDSGGLQEECAHFGIPVVVFRTHTERTALANSGAVKLAPTGEEIKHILEDIFQGRFAYGDGDAAKKIANIIDNA